jgi:cytochrome P450
MDFISKTMIAQMPYLDAVIKESMRLYPVAPFVVRKLTTNITIPGEKCNDQSTATILPSSTFACIWIYALHRNSELWHSPDEFIPERWIDPQLREMDAGQEEPGAYIPFAMGPRNCLGRPLAQVVLRVLLARLLNRYMVIDPRYEALKGESSTVDTKCLRKDMQAGFTVLPSNGLELMLRYKDK